MSCAVLVPQLGAEAIVGDTGDSGDRHDPVVANAMAPRNAAGG